MTIYDQATAAEFDDPSTALSDDPSTAALLDGRYRLEECVGQGGTASVYRAEDTALGRTVAIKLLRPAAELPISSRRAYGESVLLASMSHPSLVTLYDARLDATRPQYLVMEYVNGPTLARRLVDGPLSTDEVARLAQNIAEALQTVHDTGVIHRDVKPSNILLARAHGGRGEWRAKLTDFGIAFGVDDARLTSPGIAVGTAAYMAPEQVVGSPELTSAVDVYAFGLVLIEAFTGTPAFPVTGGVQTALRRLTSPPEIPAALDERWRDLLLRMTRHDPAERPTAKEVAAILAAQGEPARAAAAVLAPTVTMSPVPARRVFEETAAGPTREYPTRRGSRVSRRRRPFPVRGAVLAALTAIVATVLAVTVPWSVAQPSNTPGRADTRVPVTQQQVPTPAPSVPAVDDATNEDPAPADAVADTAEGGSTADTGNANKGPGSNSGNAGQRADDGSGNNGNGNGKGKGGGK